MEYLHYYKNLKYSKDYLKFSQNTSDQEVLFRINLHYQVFFLILLQIDR
jgi:hypothetical protein